ncbi:accessory gene regulator ArgB-like protein [Clostridium sp. B9]|uniref:accessory gene regulator ArgB-like protein n=1 Tax=Clostridium sp. B9 TaxID=3423224 RepID=UPI003D2EC3A6
MIVEVSKRIAEKVSEELNYDNEKKEVIQYGTYALIQTLLSIISVLILGLIFGVAVDALVFLFTASILRKYSGGAHSESPNTCTALGIIMSLGVGLILKAKFFLNLDFLIIVISTIIVFVFAYFVIYKYAPVDSPNKPIKTEKKKKRMRKGSFKILTIYLSIIIIGSILFYNFNLITVKPVIISILLGTLWQCITLLKVGHVLLKTIDSFANKL